MSPNKENDVFKPGMSSYSFEVKSQISYGEMRFKSFIVREVYINGKQKGEFHIKPANGKDPVSAVIYLRHNFPECSVGLADPSGLLSLEYPIYLICKMNSMILESIPQIFEKIDEEIGNESIP